MLLGPVAANIADGEIELAAQAKLPFTGPMTIAQLAATDLSTLTGALQLTSAFTATLPLRLDLSGLQLPEDAALELDTADLFSGQLSIAFAGLSFTRDIVDVDLDGDGTIGANDLNDVTAIAFGITLGASPLRVGATNAGFELTGGNARIAVITAADSRRWIAAQGTGLSGALHLGTLATAALSGVGLDVNRGPSALDWTKIDTDETGTFTATGFQGLTPAAGLKVDGTLAQLDLGGVISGGASFAAAIQTVTAGELLTLGLDDLTVKLGKSGDGLAITAGKVGVAYLGGHLGVVASGLAGTLAFGTTATATLASGSFRLNSSAFDWTAVGATVTPITGITIDLTTAISEAAGSLADLSIAGLVTGTGTFTLATREVTTTIDGETLTNAGLMTFALTVGALRIGEATGPRLTISAGSLTLAVLKAPQTAFADQRRWLALSGSMTAALEGVSAVTATVTDASLEINTAALDWTTLGVAGIALTEKATRAKGTIAATLGSSGSVAGSFTYERQGTTTVLGLNGATITVAGDPRVTDGTGVLVLQANGVAGFLSGKAAIVTGGVQIGGRVLFRVNTTGGAVDKTVSVAGNDVSVHFGESEGNTFSVSISDLELSIGGVVTIRGTGTFTTTTLEGRHRASRRSPAPA